MSTTALMVAAYRARASAQEGAICHDPWAAALAGEAGFEAARRFDRGFPDMTLWMAVRTAFIDRRVEALLDAGLAQVVLLGAGMDTRAARLARPGVRFFEVDQPEAQAAKRAGVSALEGYPQEAAIWVTCDFERQDFVERLVEAGFDLEAPAVFIWEGVTFYLTPQAVEATLRRLGQGVHGASVVIFDHMGSAMTRREKLREGQGLETYETLEALGEPLRFGTSNPTPLLAQAGFRHVQTVSFEQACLGLTGARDPGGMFRLQWLTQASVETWLW